MYKLCIYFFAIFVGSCAKDDHHQFPVSGDWQPDVNNEDFLKELDKLEEKARIAVQSGDSTAFQNLDQQTLAHLPASLYASAEKDAIQGMDGDQVVGMMMGLERAGSSKDLHAVLGKVDPKQFEHVMATIKNESAEFSKKQKEAFAYQMKKMKGDPSTWSADTVREMGGMMQGLSPKEIKKLASAGKDVFEASLEELAKSDLRYMSVGQRREIIDGAKSSFGDQSKWDSDTVKKMGPFVSEMRYNEFAKIPTYAIKGAVHTLGQTELEDKSARELMKKLKDSKDGFGRANTWTSETLRSLGNLTKGLSVKDIAELDRHAVEGALDSLGQLELSMKQSRKMASKMKEALGSMDKWTASTLRNASNILSGLKPRDFRQLPPEAIRGSMYELRKVRFSKPQKREIAKKLKVALGDPYTWDVSMAMQMGPLFGGLPISDLKNMSKVAMKYAIKALKEDDSVSPAKRRAILKKAKEAGDLKLKEVGSFIKSFSLKDLQDVNPIIDLGLNETHDGVNGTEGETLPWELHQARKVLKKIRNIWGDPGKWTMTKINRLKGLAIGAWKSFIESLSAPDIEDIVEAFSKQDGFTPGQVKMILKAYKDKLNLTFPSNMSRLDQIEIESLGHFVTELDEEDLENLNVDAGIEAVRQIGVTDLRHKPPGLVRKKLATCLRLLAKRKQKQDLSPQELSAEDLQDLGNLVLGFLPKQIKEINATQFKDAVEIFGQTVGYDEEQLKALVDKTKEAYKGDGDVADAPSTLSSDDVDQLGNILVGFTKEDFTAMDDHVLRDKIDDLGALPLDQQQAEGIMEQASTAKRRRRQTDLSGETGDDLIAMGNTLLALSTVEIGTVDNTAFDEAVSTIGAIKGFSRDQLQAWASKAKKAWNTDVSKITSDQLLRLGMISIGFTADELSSLSLTSDEVIESLGSQPVDSDGLVGYTSEQLSKGLSNVKTSKGKAIKDFTGNELAALGNFALVMTTDEIASIGSQEYGEVAGTFGSLKGWSADQMVKLKERCVSVYGSISTWDAADVREAGVALGGFTASELEHIKDDLLTMVSATAIASMPPDLFKTFTVDQLKQFDSSQAAAVTQAQKDVLSRDKLIVIQQSAGVSTKPSGDAGAILTICFTHLALASFLAFMFSFTS